MSGMTNTDSGRVTPSRRTFLSAAAVGAAAVPLAAVAPASASTPSTSGPSGPGDQPHPQRPDKDLRQLLREVDPDRIEATISKLVSFGTRHTLSVQDDPNRGIGAARDWLFDQFSAIAATSGGRMTVQKQSFVQPVSSRIPTPTVITNVIATLHGTTDPGR